MPGVGLFYRSSILESRGARTYRFYHIANDLVVKISHGSPFDALFPVFLLFTFESQLNEHLLKLFITKVNAELLCEISVRSMASDTSKLLLSKISNP